MMQIAKNASKKEQVQGKTRRLKIYKEVHVTDYGALPVTEVRYYINISYYYYYCCN